MFMTACCNACACNVCGLHIIIIVCWPVCVHSSEQGRKVFVRVREGWLVGTREVRVLYV